MGTWKDVEAAALSGRKTLCAGIWNDTGMALVGTFCTRIWADGAPGLAFGEANVLTTPWRFFDFVHRQSDLTKRHFVLAPVIELMISSAWKRSV